MKAFILSLLVFVCIAATAAAERAPALPSTDRLAGVDLAEGLSQITGTAISPMLGVSASGAWRYYRTPAHLRSRLPWFCHPAAWGVGFAILTLCFLKDTFGTAAPTVLKKPLDMAELFEDKCSALIASAAFVPFIMAEAARHFPETPLEPQAALAPGTHFASVLPAMGWIDIRWLLVPAGIAAFLVVWMTAHAINVLIALSPFGFVDAVLKCFKGAVLSSVALTSLIHPMLGAAFALLIVFAAAYLAPSAFRFTVFGTLFALDVLLPWRARRLATPREPHGFIARRTAGLPARTFGRVTPGDDGVPQFTYRPWVFLPRRTVRLPEGAFALAKGALYPSLLHRDEESETIRSVILFLPRYRSHEETMAGHLSILEVRDSGLLRGIRAIRVWFGEMIQASRPKAAMLPGPTG